MARHRGTPSGLRVIGRQRTAQEMERERELRILQEEAAKKRREEAAPKKLCRVERISPAKTRDQLTAQSVEQQPTEKARVTEALPSTKGIPTRKREGKTAASAGVTKRSAHERAARTHPSTRSTGSTPIRPAEAVQEPRAVTPLGLAEESFYLDHEIRHCTDKTMEGYRHDLAVIVRWLEDHEVVEPRQITAHHIRLFLHEVDSRNVSGYTLHRYARVIRAFCNFMVREDLIERSPMAKVGMPRLPKELLPAFTVDEMQRLLAAAEQGRCPVRDTAVLLTLLDTGCRSAEFLALTLGDLDLTTGQVTVIQGKGRKDRTTYLGVRARAAVVQYLKQRKRRDSRESLWLTEADKPLTKAGLRMLLDRLAKRANLTDVHPHKFRRTFALWSLRAGMNIYCLQALMGHSSLGILQRYLALVEADLEKQHREHGAVDSML